MQTPALQVPLQVMLFIHVPALVHSCCSVVLLHWVVPGLQTPQTPAPLQMPLAVSVHAVPDAVGVSTCAAPLQLVVLQPPVGSSGTSVGSGTVIVLPAPSHCSSWQSLGVCSAGGSAVPLLVATRPHSPLTHSCWKHEGAGGQSVGKTHVAVTMSPPLLLMSAPAGALPSSLWPSRKQVLLAVAQ